MTPTDGLAPVLESFGGQRLGRLVHDLNTPLAALKLQLFLLRRSLPTEGTEGLHSLEVLDRNVERMRLIIAGIAGTSGAVPDAGATGRHEPRT